VGTRYRIEIARKGAAMNIYKKIWNRLSKADRKTILLHRKVWSSPELVKMESGLSWDKLLPSTQDKLTGLDFSMILGKEVSPETE